MSLNIKTAIAAGIATLVISPAFAATQTLYGGGATLPAIAYLGSSFIGTNARLSNPQDDGSLFFEYGAFYAGTSSQAFTSYCQTGSGAGRRSLVGTPTSPTNPNPQNPADGACPSTFAIPVSPGNGFSAPAGQQDPDFVGSDAPLSATEYTIFNNSTKLATRKGLVQVPAIVGAIGFSFKNSSASSLSLTTAQVCQIVSGAISNWSQLGKPAKPLTFVYRTDGSGTTFSLSNHLTTVCSGFGFRTSDTFVANGTGVVNTAFANWVGASGNSGVQNTIAATDGAIGYGEVADTLARGGALKIAKYNGSSPTTSLKQPTLTVVSDQVITGLDANGRPVLGPAPLPAGATAGCLQLATPDSYANVAGYPIIAVSYLMTYQKNRVPTPLRKLLSSPYSSSVRNNVTTIDNSKAVPTPIKGSGFNYVKNSQSTVLNNCVK